MSSRKYLCGHCNEYLGKTLYYKHKQVYYSQEAKRWCAEPVRDDESSSNHFTFDDICSTGKITVCMGVGQIIKNISVVFEFKLE